MEMRAKEKKREEDRDNTVKALKFSAIVGAYIVAAVLVLSLLFMFLRYQFPEYFGKADMMPKRQENGKSKEQESNITLSNASPVTQNVVINIYNNGVLQNVPVKKYKDGNRTIVDIGKPAGKKKTIEALKKEILNDATLSEEEKRKKILELFSTKGIRYAGKYAGDKQKSRICNDSVVESVESANRALKAYKKEDLKALRTAILATEEKNRYSNKVCRNVMSDTQLNENAITGDNHLKLLKVYEKILRSKYSKQ
jgi:hypothetical protein